MINIEGIIGYRLSDKNVFQTLTFEIKMSLILAEISDKMPTIWQIWLGSVMFSIPVLLGIFHKWIAWLFVLFASVFSIWLAYDSYCVAFIEPIFSDAVQNEMGYWWITNDITSSLLPVVVALIILLWHLKLKNNISVPENATANSQN